MAITWKDTESKKSPAKRTIKISNVHIDNSMFEDEEGNIANRLAEILLPDMDCFDLAIKFELPDDGENDEGEESGEDMPF